MPFTPAQQEAVSARNRELLVTAAAGSGKTRVLIERIYSLIRDDGLSIDRMLVVTFTHAAAAEMRERLQTRLSEAGDGGARMRRQAELMETANISTLHSFCQKLLRTYFQTVDIDPLSTLGDEAVCANLRDVAKEDAMEALYSRAAQGDAQSKALTGKFEDAQISTMLDELYRFLMALPDPLEWLRSYTEKIYTEEDLRSGEMAGALLSDCRLLIYGAMELAEKNIALGEEPLCPEKYHPVMKADEAAVRDLLNTFSGGIPAVGAAAEAFSLVRMPTIRNLEGAELALKEQYQANRAGIKKLVKQAAKLLPQDTDNALARLNTMRPALCGLAELAGDMRELYAQRKRERNLLDYNDLEHMALAILKNPAIREEVSARFDAVFVDEYQDISGVQEAILNALKRDVSRETSGPPQRYFYVGDVKQSIYRFRQADPTLFMKKAAAFSTEPNAIRRRINLNANFRSREMVLDGVNRVFERVMRADVTEIDYNEEARLVPGLPGEPGEPVTLHLFTGEMKTADRVRRQAEAIGREILRRVDKPVTDLNGEPAGTRRYRDFAVLGPKMKGVADIVESTLNDMGIPVYCEDRGSGMASEEISQTLNHLHLLDNIADDLALIAFLRGPVIAMDERELAAVRLRKPEGSYLEAVRDVAGEDDVLGRRCAAALSGLEHERFLLAETPLDQYLWGWLNRSGLYAFYGCQPGGKLRQANLRMLCQKAGEHVQQRGGGLKGFLQASEAQTGVRGGDSPTVLGPREDVVRVMTIHKSKGLEFPVVFVMGLEESFGRRPSSLLAMHPRLGVALPYVNEETRTTDDTMLKGAITLRAQTEARAERARLLYVAMTRAKEELILLGTDSRLSPEQWTNASDHTDEGSAYAVFSAGSMLAWLCQCLNGGDEIRIEQAASVSDISTRRTGASDAFSLQSTTFPQKTRAWRVIFHIETDGEEEQGFVQGSENGDVWENREARLRAVTQAARGAGQPGLAAAETPPRADAICGDPVAPPLCFEHHPFKIGATALSYAERMGGAAATEPGESEEDTGLAEEEEKKRLPLPFARPKQMDDLPAMPSFIQPPAEQTGLRRGIAQHKALSLLAYPPLRDAGEGRLAEAVESQLDALCARRLITPEERALMDAAPLTRFFQSPAGRRALRAETVRREWSFNLTLPERDGLIVQGIIDLCYLWEGQWVLVDYKTDRVSTPEALWALYGEQIGLYRRALEEATGTPVREATLFSLSLGAGATR